VLSWREGGKCFATGTSDRGRTRGTPELAARIPRRPYRPSPACVQTGSSPARTSTYRSTTPIVLPRCARGRCVPGQAADRRRRLHPHGPWSKYVGIGKQVKPTRSCPMPPSTGRARPVFDEIDLIQATTTSGLSGPSQACRRRRRQARARPGRADARSRCGGQRGGRQRVSAALFVSEKVRLHPLPQIVINGSGYPAPR